MDVLKPFLSQSNDLNPFLPSYVAYTITLQHRDSWQNSMNVAASKAELTVFALELSKDLGMRYVAPALPVEIALKSNGLSSPNTTEKSLESLTAGILENKKFK